MDRAIIVEENFRRRVAAGDFPKGAAPHGPLAQTEAVGLFRAQCLSRALDLTSRAMQKAGQGFYTIGSSGHEGMAAVAHALRPTDPAFLHYRDAAFQIARGDQVPGQSMAWDMLLSFACSSEDPISGGRHKVLGSKALAIPPQTSTIASHLPKAVGAAYSFGLAKKLKPEHQSLPEDGIVLCSFGDASLNHSTAQGALNTASWAAYQNSPLPLLFVCEDNGIGISVKTPSGWVEASVSQRPGLRYERCDGLDVVETYQAASELGAWVRSQRKPAFLHMSCVRLYGHAGPDAQHAYLSNEEIEAAEANDPLLHTARRLIEEGALSAEEVIALYEEIGAATSAAAEEAIAKPRLKTADEVVASLVPPQRACKTTNGPSEEARANTFGSSDQRALAEPQHMAKHINFALTDLMLEHAEIVLAGEDVGRKGGVYGVTQKLHGRFGAHRVIDTLLDEQSILGLGIGMAQNGLLPIPEIQFLAYLHNAEDQLRGESATLPFFSKGQFTNPMVVRIAGLGYQKGFGGHFHNDNSVAVLRDIPGLILACPSNGTDAARMLRECIRLAREEQRLVCFLEPIALYPMRDLHQAGDGGWMTVYPELGESLPMGSIGQHGQGTDLAIVSFANGVFLSRQAQPILERKGIKTRIIDLRWLSPLPIDALVDAVTPCERVLVVDETRRSGGVSESVMAALAEHTDLPVTRLAAEDSFIATGPAFAATMPSRDSIVEIALSILGATH